MFGGGGHYTGDHVSYSFTLADFMLNTNYTSFTPDDMEIMMCVQFTPVQDEIVEGDEVMYFRADPYNSLDEFDGSNSFSLSIIDDDGSLCLLANKCYLILYRGKLSLLLNFRYFRSCDVLTENLILIVQCSF